jgi:hypothetical protein
VDRREAEAIYDGGRDAVVEVLLALAAQNERLQGHVERLTARVDKLERELVKNSRNSSRPPSADRPGAPPRRGKDRSGAQAGRCVRSRGRWP